MNRWLPALILALPCAAQATVLEALSLEDLALRATRVVEGQVIETTSRWSGRHIETVVTVEVERCHKGDCVEQVVRLVTPGGRVDGVNMRVFGAPRFVLHEQVLLFLEPGPRALRPVGMSQGRFALSGRLGEQVAERAQFGAERVGAWADAALELDRLPLRVLLERIDRALDGSSPTPR